jgi:hypothetical protein
LTAEQFDAFIFGAMSLYKLAPLVALHLAG